MPESPGMGVLTSCLAGSRGVDLFTSSVLAVGVDGDSGSDKFKVGGRRITFPSLGFVWLSRSARNNTT
jgi:hypothetical protein